MVRVGVILLATATALIVIGGLTQMWGYAFIAVPLFVGGIVTGAVGALASRR